MLLRRVRALLLALSLVVIADATLNLWPSSHSAVGWVAGLEYGPDALVWGDGESPFVNRFDPPSYYPWDAGGGAYSHEPGCEDDGIDPVGLILVPPAPNYVVESAFSAFESALIAAGLPEGEDSGPINGVTDRQYYFDNDACVKGEVTQGQNWGYGAWFGTLSRWHARCNLNSVRSSDGYWASCTPHWDQETGHEDCDVFTGIFGGHYVPPSLVWQGVDWGGFSAAREQVRRELLLDGALQVSIAQFNNVREQSQCNHVVSKSKDGAVYVIRID